MPDGTSKLIEYLREDITYIKGKVDELCDNALPRISKIEERCAGVQDSKRRWCGLVMTIIAGVAIAFVIWLSSTISETKGSECETLHEQRLNER